MAFGKLHPANFMGQLAPTNTQGRDLRSIDQCAMSIKLDREQEEKERAKRMLEPSVSRPPFSGPLAMQVLGRHSMADFERDWEIRSRSQKREHRGGMTMRPNDGLIAPVRQTFRDRDSADPKDSL